MATDDDDDHAPPRRRHRVAIVSDFFYPRLGGVELHQYSLAQALIARGHHVVVITGTFHCHTHTHSHSHSHSRSQCKRQGVRYLTCGLKVYHLPHLSFHQQATLPSLVTLLPWFRSIVLTERLSVIHCHAATSFLAHECLLHAATLGLRSLYTDHSLFSLHSLQSLNLNKGLEFSLANANHFVAVSHCDKENLVLRANLHPADVSVIPNAVDCTKLVPSSDRADLAPTDRIVIVVIARLVYRKGLDLIVPVIPVICHHYPHVDWLIGGDGPKRVALAEMIELHSLHDRVRLLGSIPHNDIAAVLNRGHIFLNCSLTESFCIAILEAVSVGLEVVATNVGGVSEILPASVITFAEPNTNSIVESLRSVIDRLAGSGQSYSERLTKHRTVKAIYNWHAIAQRTEAVYDSVASQSPSPTPVIDRLVRLMRCGIFSGPLYCAIAILDWIFLLVLEWLMPVVDVDESCDWPR